MSGAPISESDVQAFVDGRLGPARAAEVEAWLAERPEEAARAAALRQDREALRAAYGPIVDEPLPPRLAAVFAQAGTPLWRRAAAAVLIFVAGAAAGWAGGYFGPAGAPARSDMIREAIGAHRVFIPEVRHPVEVSASEEAHLVAWLSKKLGHTLKAPDLSQHGFRLVGGRLLSDSGRPAALFMYENSAGLRVTIHCVSEPNEGETAFRYREIDGVSAFYWIDEKLAYAVVAKMRRDRLLEIARTTYAALEHK